jgi:hypothetical protein
MKKILYYGAICILAFGYTKLTDSKKRFLKELARQVPYLIPRYYV